MFELIRAGGWLMVPIIGCSILALAITVERFINLRRRKVLPPGLLASIWETLKSGNMTAEKLRAIKRESPLGSILAAGLNNSKSGREIMKESMEEEAGNVVHQLERFLNALGIIAAITPLMGLLGTVVGMIHVFAEIMQVGTGNANVLAGGISQALVTTAAGLLIAIPALVVYRMLQRHIDSLMLTMEQEATKLVEMVHGNRHVQVD